MSTFIIRCLWIMFLLANGPMASGSEQYRIGVDDVLSVTVLEEAEFSGVFRVASDGAIDYPFIRKIAVKSTTTEELAKIITERLKQGFLKDPQVQVDIKEHNSQKVLVLGAVTKPGSYTLKEATRVLDIISMAGGISSLGGKRVILLREQKNTSANTDKSQEEEPTISRSATPLMIDYYGLVNKGDMSQNHLLCDGDIVNVPKANEIFLLGNIGRPGPLKFEDNMTILQAVTLAGGPTPTASTRSTYILRQSEAGEQKVQVRLDKILDNKEKNVALKPDDVIVIPESFF